MYLKARSQECRRKVSPWNVTSPISIDPGNRTQNARLTLNFVNTLVSACGAVSYEDIPVDTNSIHADNRNVAYRQR
jgi:hypothetical protein